MYSILTSLLDDKKGGEIFTCFGAWHIGYIVFFIALVSVILAWLRGKSGGVWDKTASVFVNTSFALYVLDFFAMPLAYGEIDIEKLPFHACTAMCVACFLSNHVGSLRKYRTSFALLGFISNFVYLVYPAGVMWHAVHPLSYRVIQTLTFHGIMSVYGLLVILSERESFKWKSCYRELALLALMTVWAILGNMVYNSDARFYNWFFVVRDPFYILPESIAPFVMPFVNIAVFFGVEMLIYLILIKTRPSENGNT